ncbi:hypothetical protein A4S02_10795 [Acetobacter ascendens]|uniref:Uncharacterized protein n=1 Tax=Acetobacter ascendens TaxID=481146 RepID=A0A1D8QXV5_9PROT|nr:hypothetical protein [Acetobacter ascendens]AOW47177.1 hypothetical protein A4S02_10795 [Acetobacter ascendens]
MTKKLKILGPYTPEHEGPFCTRDGIPVELKIRDGRSICPLQGYIGDEKILTKWWSDGRYTRACEMSLDLMNAREVPVAREFWVNEYARGFGALNTTREEALRTRDLCQFSHIIHVREVLPGEGE